MTKELDAYYEVMDILISQSEHSQNALSVLRNY